MNEYRSLFLELRDKNGQIDDLPNPTNFFGLHVQQRNEVMATIRSRIAALAAAPQDPQTTPRISPVRSRRPYNI